MTPEQLFAAIVGIIIATAFTSGVSVFVLRFFFSRKEAGRSRDLTGAA